MNRQDVIALLNYLFKFYPNSAADKNALLDSYYAAFKNNDRYAVKHIIDKYLEQGSPYFPMVQDLKRVIAEEVWSAHFIIRDPRNKYYERDPESWEMRKAKIEMAKKIVEEFSTQAQALITI